MFDTTIIMFNPEIFILISNQNRGLCLKSTIPFFLQYINHTVLKIVVLYFP
jgi:hypothetical protein